MKVAVWRSRSGDGTGTVLKVPARAAPGLFLEVNQAVFGQGGGHEPSGHFSTFERRRFPSSQANVVELMGKL